MRLVLVLCISLCFSWSDQKSTPEDESYVAAVLEYQFTRNTSQNLPVYLDYMRQAAEQDADIIVFPEMTLTRGNQVKVPIHGLLKEHPVPALHPELYDEILVSLSAAAREHQIYALVNLQEVMDCTDAPGEFCPTRKTYLFNTNVVFDRNGAVIDRYRKINLFGEYTRHPALRPDLGLFRTDFGVTFGHFICFDIMFQVPATQIVQKHRLTDIVFSTMWFSEMPFLTAVQSQEEYAYTMNVNLLAANANNLKVGSAGSGIYSGNAGALVSVTSGTAGSHLLVTKVPKKPGHVPKFRAFVKDGTNTYAKRKIGVAFCAVVACKDDTAVSCPYKFTDSEMSTEFQELEISMSTYSYQYNSTLQCDNVVYYPSSLRNNKFPLHPQNYSFIKSSQNGLKFQDGDNSQDGGQSNDEKENDLPKDTDREHVSLKLTKPQNDLVSFSLWGRLYIRDVNPVVEASEEDVNNYIQIENIIYNHGERQSTD